MVGDGWRWTVVYFSQLLETLGSKAQPYSTVFTCAVQLSEGCRSENPTQAACVPENRPEEAMNMHPCFYFVDYRLCINILSREGVVPNLFLPKMPNMPCKNYPRIKSLVWSFQRLTSQSASPPTSRNPPYPNQTNPTCGPRFG